MLTIINGLPIKEQEYYVEFDSIKTGKRNANHETENGEYNFYTCGEKIRKCSEYSFSGKYILLSGNASLYSWWYEGKFDLYQRVYALIPTRNFFTSYHSVRAAMQKLREESSGSVIKYIKLDDIKRIKMLDDKYEHELSVLYRLLLKIDKLLENCTAIKKEQINLLVK